ncbi:MAG: metallophosphatase family protein [Silicimonas sp.]|nr:metallophosphatase family protein [Silicimonas sp.]
MTLAVLSDIHGNIAALEAVLADIDRRGISNIVNLGDSLSGPFDGLATAERLIALDLPTVSGNHDRQLVDRPKDQMGLWEAWVIDDLAPAHLDWIAALPDTAEAFGAFLCHGTPESDEENWLDRRGPGERLVARDLDGVLARDGGRRERLLLCGHTHTPRVVRLPGDRMVVNPGSVGCPAYLDSRMEPNFIHQTGAPDARYAIVEERDGRWSADLVAVPYDASEMAAMARAKGAESWAQAVSDGWFA